MTQVASHREERCGEVRQTEPGTRGPLSLPREGARGREWGLEGGEGRWCLRVGKGTLGGGNLNCKGPGAGEQSGWRAVRWKLLRQPRAGAAAHTGPGEPGGAGGLAEE